MTRPIASMLRRFISQTLLLWIAFLLTATTAAVAIHRLYQTAHEEIAAQSDHLLQRERSQVLEQIRTYTEHMRRSTIVELAAFHEDGLTQSLRKWDDAREVVVGTFQWDPAQGFLASSPFPPGAPSPDQVAGLWHEFRAWRAGHLKSTKRDPLAQGRFQTSVYSTMDNSLFPSSDLGYQTENLEIVAYAGRHADPWAGWGGLVDDPLAPWVIWYQTGPEEPIRGCFIDVRWIVAQLRSQNLTTVSARHELMALPISGAASPHALTDQLPELPSYFLTVDPGDLFAKKETSARLSALTAAALFALFILGGLVLTFYTRREKQDAERKINFVGQVSHELRTPLTSIRMYADLLGQPDLLETKRLKFAQTIGRESARLGVLVERLLALNELERGNRKITSAPVDLVAVIHETVDEMNGALSAAGITVETKLPEGGIFVRSDHSALKQALLNLLENAEKYARDGKRILITVISEPNLVLVEVSDFGPGIPRSLRARLFEPFVQGAQTLTTKSPGVGLGLSIARGTLRRVGGDLVLLQTERGATFQLRLPASSTPIVSAA